MTATPDPVDPDAERSLLRRDPDASLPAGFEGQRATFELLVLIPVIAILPLCAVLYALGGGRRAGTVPHG